MGVVKTNNSVKSCDHKKELFQAMFPNACPEGLSLSPSKVQYLITEALGPYFKNKMLLDLKNSESSFALLFDDTSNAKSMKELQIRLRFWSGEENCIVNRHLETYYIEKADGNTLFSYLQKAIESNDLTYDKVLTLGCDGPKVNHKVARLFEENLAKLKLKRLLNIGTCNLHIAHNAYLKGIDCFDLDASDFVVKVYYYFHKRDLRCEEFRVIQKELNLPLHVFVMHCNTRWLTLGSAAERMLEQLPALSEYFLRHIPKKYPKTLNNQKYLDIREYLKNPTLKANMQFIVYSAKIFTSEFTLLFQKEEPLIHVLYSQLRKLILLLLSNVVKPDIFEEMTTVFDDVDFAQFLSKTENFVFVNDVKCGEKVEKSIEKLNSKDKAMLLLNVKNFYIESVKHLTSRIRDFDKLKYFTCFSPENIKNVVSVRYASKIASLLPLKNVDCDQAENEWKLLQFDLDIRPSLNEEERIDKFWSKIISLKTGSFDRYPTLKLLVKSALAISHGNADVERGFSKSGQILTIGNTNLIERTHNAKLFINDGLKAYDSLVHKVPITVNLLQLARNAHRSYCMHLDKEKEIEAKKLAAQAKAAKRVQEETAFQKSIDKETNEISKLENKLQDADKELAEASKSVDFTQQTLINVANNDPTGAVVQNLVKSLENLRAAEKDKRKTVDNLRKKIEQKRSNLIKKAVSKRKTKSSKK